MFVSLFGLLLLACPLWAAEEECVVCHSRITPGQVADWRLSAHAENGIVITSYSIHYTKLYE